MKTNNSKTKAKAFLGAAALIIAATLALTFTGCKQPAAPEPEPAPPPKYAVLTVGSKQNIKVKAVTTDGSDITVKGCDETILKSGQETTLNAKSGGGAKVTLTGNIVELYCSENKLAALDVQNCTTLQKLECNKNDLTELNLQGLTSLKHVVSRENTELTVLNVQGCTALQHFECIKNNKLSALNLQGLTSLENVYSSQNAALAALDVQGCSRLTKLDAGYNKLTQLNLKKCTRLQDLNCHQNELQNIDLKSVPNLKKLSCGANKLNSSFIAGIKDTKIEELYCNFMWSIGPNLSVKDCKDLKTLECPGCDLTGVDIEGCSALEWLNVSSNKLNKEAFIKIFKALPQRTAGDEGEARLYDRRGDHNFNFENFASAPPDIKQAFREAKAKNWKLKRLGVASWINIRED